MERLFLGKAAARRAAFIGLMGAVCAAGAVAQTPPTPTDNPSKVRPSASLLGLDAFNAKSVEKAYSAGRFGVDIDNYLGVNDWQTLDLNGTFLFLGGYTFGSNKEITPAPELPDGRVLQAGFAKTFGIHYVGAYFSGSSVTWNGETLYDNDGKKNEDSKRTAPYTNAVLFYANEGIGALRFDMIFEGAATPSEYKENEVAETESWDDRKGPMTAVTWGKNMTMGGKTLKPHVRFGVKWSDNGFNKASGVETKTTAKGGWGLKAGADWGAVGGDLTLGYMFGEETKVSGSDDNDKAHAYKAGTFFLPVNVKYADTLNATDKLTFKYKGNLFLQWARQGGKNKETGADEVDGGATNYFEIKPTVDLGMKYQLHRKFALYTGAQIELFDFTAAAKSKGDTDKDPSATAKDDWYFSGIAFNNGFDYNAGKPIPGTNLGLGLVFEPIANLKIGCGANWLLDHFIKIDLKNTSVETGDFFTKFKPNLDTDMTGGILDTLFGGAKIYLTVSYKMGGKTADAPDAE